MKFNNNMIGRAVCWSAFSIAISLLLHAGAVLAAEPSKLPPGEALLKQWAGQPADKVQRAAEGGDAAAQYYLAWHYFDGSDGLPVDFFRAMQWFRRAAESGVPEAQLKLGFCARRGIGMMPNFAECEKWLLLAAESGLATAQGELIDLYENGGHVDVELRDKATWDKKIHPLVGKLDEWTSAARAQEYGPVSWMGSQDMGPQKFARLRAAAAQGVWDAQSTLFFMLMDGSGGEKSPTEAWMWFEMQRQHGQTNMVGLVNSPQGWEKDEVVREGKKLLAQFRPSPTGIKWQHAEEVTHFWNPGMPTLAVENSMARYSALEGRALKGEADAQFLMGLCLQHKSYNFMYNYMMSFRMDGKEVHGTVSHNFPLYDRFSKAVEWYRRAALQGHRAAQWNMAFMIWNDLGALRRDEALKIFQRFADEGNPDAACIVGKAYHLGEAGVTDEALALKYLRMAAEHGSQEARGRLLELGVDIGAKAVASQAVPGVEPTTAGPVRLAVVTTDPQWRAAGDLLTVELTKDASVTVLERDEVQRVLEEQERAAGSQRDYVKLGRLLRADGLLLLETKVANEQPHLVTRLVATGPGAVLGFSDQVVTKENAEGWAGVVHRQYQTMFPKLRVSPKEVIALSLLSLRSAANLPGNEVLERDLTVLLTHRLVREKNVLLLERQRMDRLRAENSLTDVDDRDFWKGSYLLDGVIDRDGTREGTVSLSVQLKPSGGGPPIAIERTGRRDQLAVLVDELARDILGKLQQRIVPGQWTTREEAVNYWEEARWARRWGLNQEALEAVESANTLGYRTSATDRLLLDILIETRHQAMPGHWMTREEAGNYLEKTLKGMEMVNMSGHREPATDRLRMEAWINFSWEDQPEDEVDLVSVKNLQKAMDIYFSQGPPSGTNSAPDVWGTPENRYLRFPKFLFDSADRILIHAYHVPAEIREGEEALLQLRRSVRSLFEWYRKIPGNVAEEQDRWLLQHAVEYGPIWQENVQAAEQFEHWLIEQGWEQLYRKYRLYLSDSDRALWPVNWNYELAFVRRARWEKFLQHEWNQGKAEQRLAVATLALETIEGNDSRLEWVNRTRAFLMERKDDFATERLPLSGWNNIENALDGDFWNRTLGMPNQSKSHVSSTLKLVALRDVLPADLAKQRATIEAGLIQRKHELTFAALKETVSRGITHDASFDANQIVTLCTGFNLTIDEARQLMPLLKIYEKNRPSNGISLSWLEDRLRQMLPKEMAEEKTESPATSSGLRSDPVEVHPLMPPERVLNLAGMTMASGHHLRNVEMGAAVHRGEQLFVPVVYEVPENGTDNTISQFFSILQIDGKTLDCKEIPVGPGRPDWLGDAPTTQMRNLPSFAMQGDWICVSHGRGVRRYSLSQKRWEDISLPMEDGACLYSVANRLYASSLTSISEIDLASKSVTLLASSRRRPAQSLLDQGYLVGRPLLVPGPSGAVRVVLASRLAAYDTRTKDWKFSGNVVPGTEPFYIPILLDELRWSESGLLYICDDNGHYFRAVRAVWPEEANAVLCLKPASFMEVGLGSVQARWGAIPALGHMGQESGATYLADQNLAAILDKGDLWLADTLPAGHLAADGKRIEFGRKGNQLMQLHHFVADQEGDHAVSVQLPPVEIAKPDEVRSQPDQQVWGITTTDEEVFLINSDLGMLWAFSKEHLKMRADTLKK